MSVTGKECGIPGACFRGLGGGTTLAGGRYEASVPIRTKTMLRAEWKEAQSATVVVYPARLRVAHEGRGGRRGRTVQRGHPGGWQRVRVERLTPAGWKLLQMVVVKSEGYGGRAEKDKLRFKVPERTTLRAVLPRSQTGRCLLAGYSALVRT